MGATSRDIAAPVPKITTETVISTPEKVLAAAEPEYRKWCATETRDPDDVTSVRVWWLTPQGHRWRDEYHVARLVEFERREAMRARTTTTPRVPMIRVRTSTRSRERRVRTCRSSSSASSASADDPGSPGEPPPPPEGGRHSSLILTAKAVIE